MPDEKFPLGRKFKKPREIAGTGISVRLVLIVVFLIVGCFLASKNPEISNILTYPEDFI